MSLHCKGMPFAWAKSALIILLFFGSTRAQADSPTKAESTQSYSYTLKQLGANYPMSLRGVEGNDSVSFDVRADEVVTHAQLNLEYSYSPALLSDLSQINVLVNDQLAASLPAPKETAGMLLRKVVDIPPHLITGFNRLRLQLIGHYAMQCEDPLHSSLWAKIDNRSRLDLQVKTLKLPNDLALLPLPFFDKRDARLLELPFVFASSPDNNTLEAAGVISSWFGALASYRGAKFPVRFGQLPEKGNAIVLVNSRKAIEGLTLPEGQQPHLSLAVNPNDPHGKLLLISGHNGEQLKQAAQALVSGNRTFSGASVQIEQVDLLLPRKPYDAPNWLPTDRPVQLGELIETKKLSVSGYDPGTIGIGMRLPPDLFDWRQDGIALHLKYRYTPQPVSTNSSLLVSVDGKFIKSLPLPSLEHIKANESFLTRLINGDSLIQESQLSLPLSSLPLQSKLELRFMYDYIKQGECRDVIIDNMRGAIEPNSILDLSGYEHFIAMPNLGVFQNSGFPFTRMADLSETTIILAEQASTKEVSTFLTLLGRFGESTGLPATAITVSQGKDDMALKGKDLLVLALGSNQPLLDRWVDRLPASFENGQQKFKLSDLVYRVRDWFSSDQRANLNVPNTRITTRGNNVDAYLAGFESPLDKGRSVVVVASSTSEGLSALTDALSDDAQLIQGSLSVVNAKQISSLLAEEQYFVGELSWLHYIQWLMSRHVWWLLLLTAAGVSLVSLLLYFSLRARARMRLNE